MNRRGLFGALVGGIAAATGVRALARMPTFSSGRRVVMIKGTAVGKTDRLVSRLVLADEVDPFPLTWPGSARLSATVASASADPGAAMEELSEVAFQAPPTVPADLPDIWPGHSGAITATVALPPLAQVERLVELFGASGEEAPSFAAALIGELVLTRMRLAAADPKTLWGLES